MSNSGDLVVVGSTGTLVRQAVAFGAELGWSPHQLATLTPELRATILAGDAAVFVALDDDEARAALIAELLAGGIEPTQIVHPSAWVSPTARLGHNVMIGPNCVVAMDAVVGNGVVQNALGSIEHDNQIGDHTFLGTGVILCGRVVIGEHSFIGGGAVVKPGVSIADRVVIGTGAVVVKDTEPGRTYVGNPARPLGTTT